MTNQQPTWQKALLYGAGLALVLIGHQLMRQA